MGRYGFVGVGGLAGDAITQFLMQRELENRQRMMDELTQQKTAAGINAQQEELAFRREQEGRIADAQRQAQDDLANQREFTRAGTITENALPGDPADAATRAILERQGYGGQIRKVPGVVMQGPLPETQTEADRPTSPDTFEMRGGSKYLSARAAEDARSAEAEANRQAAAERAAAEEAGRNERAQAANELKALIAKTANSTNAETVGLRNELLRMQAEMAKDKLETTRAERDKAEKTKTDAATNTLTLLDRLEKHPGLDKAYGAYEMRGFTQDARDFKAIRDQTVAALTLPNLGSLKGPMSDKDVAFVKNLATRLQDPNISEAEARRAISDARATLEGRTLEAAPGGGEGWTDAGNGVRIRPKPKGN